MATNNDTAAKDGVKVKVQKLGSFLSGMIMPNIAGFIAWGIITALFIEVGWLPNEELATIVGPMLTYLLPILIAFTGGHKVYGHRGGVVGAIATMGVIGGSTVPMFIGAMAMGPFASWLIKKFDKAMEGKIKSGFEMLVNNFSAGIIGFILAVLGFYAVGPFVETFTSIMANGVDWLIGAGLLSLANIFIEPAKVLFLNNAINHGILTPLGIEQAAETGKSILFLLEANPGPGLGLLGAYMLFGKGSAKSTAAGAAIIHFFGGIHEIYFPYVLMNPVLFLAVIAGGIAGTFVNSILGSGLIAAASPGSIIAIFAMSPKGGFLPVIAGVLAGAVVSFLVASIILKATKPSAEDETSFEDKVAQTVAMKTESKGQATQVSAAGTKEENISAGSIKKIIFACDAGMGSSAMGASLLRKKVTEAGMDIPVTNMAISNLEDVEGLLVVTQEELLQRAKAKTPNAVHVGVNNFLSTPKYDEIVEKLKK